MVFVSDSSGRFLTSYTPNCIENAKIKQEFGLTNDYDYRMFLQRNAMKLVERNVGRLEPKNKLICDCPRCGLISQKNFFNKRQKYPKTKKVLNSGEKKELKTKLQKFQDQFNIPDMN